MPFSIQMMSSLKRHHLDGSICCAIYFSGMMVPFQMVAGHRHLCTPVQSEIETFKLSVDDKLDGLFSLVKEAAYIQRTSNLSLSNSRTVFNFASVSGLYSRKVFSLDD